MPLITGFRYRLEIDGLRAVAVVAVATAGATVDGYDKIAPKTITDIESVGGRILDPTPRFLDPTGERYIFPADGVVLYSDRHHLTAEGAKLMLLPFLCDSLTPEKK
jgi:hypothetical protein